MTFISYSSVNPMLSITLGTPRSTGRIRAFGCDAALTAGFAEDCVLAAHGFAAFAAHGFAFFTGFAAQGFLAATSGVLTLAFLLVVGDFVADASPPSSVVVAWVPLLCGATGNPAGSKRTGPLTRDASAASGAFVALG